MKIKIAYTIALLILIACRSSNQHKLSAEALNDSVIVLTKHYGDTSEFKRAITLLDNAIEIDSNYFDSYKKKLYFETSLGDFNNAAKTLTRMMKFRPDSADLYFQAGLFKELTNDTVTSKVDFSKAVLLYKLTLDTMDKKNPYWFANWKNSAICLIMTGQEQIIHDFLKQNCTTAFDSSIYDVETLSKSRQELLQRVRNKYIR